MQDHTYGISEIVGSSETSIEDAVQNAIANAAENRRNIRWFEVVDTRGHVEGGKVKHYQVHIRLGYLIED